MRRPLAAIVAVLALTACAGPTRPAPSAAAPTTPAPSVRTFHTPMKDEVYLIALNGVLGLTAGGCVAYRDRGGAPSVVVWPPGITATPDGVLLPDYGLIRFGERIHPAAGIPVRPRDQGDVPADCWGAGAPPGDVVLLKLDSGRPVRAFNGPTDVPRYAPVVPGTLARTSGGCVALVRGSTAPVNVAVFRPGVTATEDGVRVPDGRRIRFGAWVDGGATVPWSPDNRYQVPPDCWAGDEEPGGMTPAHL